MLSRKRLNNHGFTMVELLVTIVILGVLMGAAIGAVSWILDDAEDNYYETLEKNVAMGAESYYADHRGSLPKSVGQSRTILIKTLVEQGYLPDVVDRSKKDCSQSENSYVKVTKSSKSNYKYDVYLDCPSYQTTDNTVAKTVNINVTFNAGTNPSATINVSTSSDNQIASYQYYILQNEQQVYMSESITVGNLSSVSRNVDLTSYAPGTVKIVVTAYDVQGTSKTVTKEQTLS